MRQPISVEYYNHMGNNLKLIKLERTPPGTENFEHCFLSVQCNIPRLLAIAFIQNQESMIFRESEYPTPEHEAHYWLPPYALKDEENLTDEAHPDSERILKSVEYMNIIDVNRHARRLEAEIPFEERQKYLPQNTMVPYIITGTVFDWFHLLNAKYQHYGQLAANEFIDLFLPIVDLYFPGGHETYIRLHEDLHEQSNNNPSH